MNPLQSYFKEKLMSGDSSEVTQIIDKLNVNGIRDENQMTPLHWATIGNDKSTVTKLLVQDADVNAVDRFGRTALHFAKGSRSPISEVLLMFGADESVTDSNKLTPESWSQRQLSSNSKLEIDSETCKEQCSTGISMAKSGCKVR